DEELDAYYQANKNQFDTCGLMGFSIPYEVPDETAETDAETEAESETPSLTEEQAKALADNLMKATSPEDFEKQVYDILLNYEGYTEDELTDLRASISNDSFSYTDGFEVSDWAFGGTAKVGETYLMEKEGYYSVYLLTREASLDTTNTVNVRHILFSISNHTESDSEDESLSEDETQAETTAEEAEAAEKAALETCWTYARNALAEWEKGDKTEDSFAELANQYSEDPGSNTNGGLYEKVYTGQMVDTFNDWCFDPSRKVGDTGLVETSYGVHVMYFAGTSDPLWKDSARNALQSDGIDSWYDEQEQKYPVAYNEDIINAIE
ncbi:MAG: peptidylprolyl isomerase, partial [Oscillospiraceae bacterium]|nr:peptidylprolyl isomerase [Oscillospiraceae bacterium]